MTRTVSDLPLGDLVSEVEKYLELQRQAIARMDIPAANRYFGKLSPYLHAMESSPAGRERLEKYLDDPRPFVRDRAAEYVIHWAPDLAVPVLGRLLVEDFGKEMSVDERSEIRCAARMSLYLHFNIEDFDRNRLIEPLKKYGIDIPYRHRR